MSETENVNPVEQENDSKKRLLWFIAFIILAVFLIVKYHGVFGNALVVAMGFGAVIMIHEFGHFIVAKLSDIKVEAFSIGFPPILGGIQRVENGWRIRILPEILKKPGTQEAQYSFTIPARCKTGETEYRIGLVPIGGFVKMLGQEDVGSAKTSDDPRSYANKSVLSRMAVITAGVTFNVISAVIIFMIVFLIGIELLPPIVGHVIPNTPAAKAGLKPGDEIVAIDGKTKNLDFSDIRMAAALSNKGEPVAMMVKHPDGTTEQFNIAAQEISGIPMKGFGITSPATLNIADVTDADVLYKELGLEPGDKVVTVNGKKVENYHQLETIVDKTYQPEISLSIQRTDKNTAEIKNLEIKTQLFLSAARNEIEGKYDLSQICSMVPRLRVTESSSANGIKGIAKFKKNNEKMGNLKPGDVILAAGGIENPTYQEFREVTTQHQDKEMEIKVLRENAVEIVTVVPKFNRETKKVLIGIAPSLDAEHPVVAKTIKTENGAEPLNIPAGATILAVNGAPVSNFYDIIHQIEQNAGKKITVFYRLDDQKTGEASIETASVKDLITVESNFAKPIPFEELKRLYKAANPGEAIKMGYDKTIIFVAQTYVTLKQLVSGLVSPKELMGPVGIVSISYRIVSQEPLIYYVYFLGLISAAIAVFNFLPLPPLDGGHIVLLTIEKIKGSALSEKAITAVAYAGWIFIGTFFLYVTFNDIVRSFVN